ncbi:MAG: hypothetical protein WEB05_06665 [Solirubrobacterales bacterium]
MTALEPSTETRVRCTGCGASMVVDQRYCLQCGKRKGEPRVEFTGYMTEGMPNGETPPLDNPVVRPVAASPPGDPRPVREITPLMAASGLAAFAVILLLGVIVGRLGGAESQTPVVAATGIPATAAPATGTESSTDVNVTFTADWPTGKEGFTIELATVSKDSTDGAGVEATKAELTAQGATEVGALDSDEFASLPVGNYVFYSGVYDAKPDAVKALAALKSSFPDAQVIEVSVDAAGSLITDGSETPDPDKAVKADKEDLEALNGASAEDFQELQQKLPPTIETTGKAPKPDNKKPGAGGPDEIEIG